MLVGAVALCGCVSAETGGGADDTGGGDGPPELGGVAVTCCFLLMDGDLEWHEGCTFPQPPICIDPDNPTIDVNQDGTLDTQELTENVCALKCPSPVPAGGFLGPGFHPPGYPSGTIDLIGNIYGCSPLSGELTAGANSCDPSHPSHLEPFPVADVSPTHEGTLSTAVPGGEAEITINGNSVTMAYTGDVAFYLDNCITTRPYVQCDLGLRVLNLEANGVPSFGDYQVTDAGVELAYPEVTTIDFVCDRLGCVGDFAFVSSVAPLAMNLNWQQTNVVTQQSSAAGLLLSNGVGGLGGLNTLSGQLDLDTSLSAGTIQVVGSGSDAFGGDIASATFDLRGTVDRK